MNEKLIKCSIGLNAPRPLSEPEKAEIEALGRLPEHTIDTSDIPELDETFRRNAQRGRFFKPIKQSTTVRIDADVLAWLKAKGKGYQTRINAILREAMVRER